MKRLFPYLKNKYYITLLALLVWIIFFDKNDMPSQVELTQKLNQLKKEKQYFLNEIDNNKSSMNELQTDSQNLEKFAREKYLMKKDNEDIFVIVEKRSNSKK